MELQTVNTSLEVTLDDEGEYRGTGAIVSLQRHEAAMVRLGYIESELAASRRMLADAAQRQQDLEQRADEAEQDAVAATVRAVEAETALEDMRSQVIDSTFKAMELQRELEDLKSEAQRPWWKKVFSSGGDSKDARK